MSIWEIFRDGEVEAIEERRRATDPTLPGADPAALADQVAHLTLVTEALWQLLSERASLQTSDLARVVIEVDRKGSGVVGEQTDATVRRCSDCDAVVPPNAPRCQFCGGEPLAPGAPRRIREPEPEPAGDVSSLPSPPVAAAPPPPVAAPPPPPPPVAAPPPPPVAAPPPPPPVSAPPPPPPVAAPPPPPPPASAPPPPPPPASAPPPPPPPASAPPPPPPPAAPPPPPPAGS